MPVDEAPVLMRVENISKNFGAIQALKGVSFELRKGEVLGFLGPNGAGKTTAMRILTGYFPPSEGKVWIGDEELFKKPHILKRRIGYLPENVSLYREMRVLEFLTFVAKLKGVSKREMSRHLEDKMTVCGLWEVKNRMIGNLSKGFKQRIGLAQALVGDPEILVFDEPTNGLDPKQIIEIRNLIRELSRERTLILSSHILPEVSMVSDRILILNAGRVVAAGTTDELEAGLSHRHEIYVSIGDRRLKTEAHALLESLPGVEGITVVHEKEDEVDFCLSTTRGQDLRPVISRLFVEHHIPLLEIRTGKLSLEEIFMKIVVTEEFRHSL